MGWSRVPEFLSNEEKRNFFQAYGSLDSQAALDASLAGKAPLYETRPTLKNVLCFSGRMVTRAVQRVSDQSGHLVTEAHIGAAHNVKAEDLDASNPFHAGNTVTDAISKEATHTLSLEQMFSNDCSQTL